ncbi:hypothetical protein RQP46_009115 [Phenoliferia psychrophenolica]
MVPAPLSRSANPAFATTHLRKRSSISNLAAVQELPSPTGSTFSDATAYEDEDESAPYPQGKKGDYSAIEINEDPEGRGWSVANAVERKPRRKFSGCAWASMLLVAGATIGWLARPGESEIAPRLSGGRGRPTSKLPLDGQKCNPYEQHGVLLVNTSVPALNIWQPIGAPESCQPIDFASQLLDVQSGSEEPHPDLDSLRNRTLLIFGDSVDRDHNEHFCGLVGGYLEFIDSKHEFSPPYPAGEEVPHEGYQNFVSGNNTEWPDNFQSRPFICHLYHLELRVVNVFHYGFRAKTDWIMSHPHYYPPATMEDRFDQIVIPLLQNIADKYKISPVPDVVSVAPGFWGILRLSMEEQFNRDMGIISGNMTIPAAFEQFSTWNNMKAEQREWMEGRIETVIRKIGKAWSDTAATPPRILWRSLHHTREQDSIPFTRAQTLDQIGRSVVERLVAEGEAAAAGALQWKAWLKRTSSRVGRKWSGAPEAEIISEDLSDRLRIDEWGALMLGQEKHFGDNIHPLPLPGSWLWSNMAMYQLKDHVDGEL